VVNYSEIEILGTYAQTRERTYSSKSGSLRDKRETEVRAAMPYHTHHEACESDTIKSGKDWDTWEALNSRKQGGRNRRHSYAKQCRNRTLRQYTHKRTSKRLNDQVGDKQRMNTRIKDINTM
jgi:hypothetical protein